MQTIIGFHNPDEAFGFLSNWYLSEFEVSGKNFTSAEQYMMYKKALLFKDEAIAAEILETSDVGNIKALGRSVKNYNDILWTGVRQLIVYDGLSAKFEQNSELKKKLLFTGESILAECSVQDVIWGIGLSMMDERRLEINAWRGKNLLGFTLMNVRSKLKRM